MKIWRALHSTTDTEDVHFSDSTLLPAGSFCFGPRWQPVTLLVYILYFFNWTGFYLNVVCSLVYKDLTLNELFCVRYWTFCSIHIWVFALAAFSVSWRNIPVTWMFVFKYHYWWMCKLWWWLWLALLECLDATLITTWHMCCPKLHFSLVLSSKILQLVHISTEWLFNLQPTSSVIV